MFKRHWFKIVDAVPEFWISVRGPLPSQPDALQLLHDALGGIEGVTVNLGVTG